MKIEAERIVKCWVHVETGNWYSEYRCPYCQVRIVVNADADKSIFDYTKCPKCKEEVKVDS